MIGIRLADHSIFPVLATGASGGKRVVLTTARDDQKRVDIELVQADDYEKHRSPALPIGRVSLDDLHRGPRGEAEVDLVLRLGPTGLLDVSATNRATGNARGISIDVNQAATEAAFSVPESLTDTFEPELALEGEEEPRSRRSGWLLVTGMLLILAALAGGTWWFMLRSPAESPVEPAIAMEESTGREPASGEPADAEVPPPPANAPTSTDSPLTDATPTDTVPDGNSVEYRIRRGDTLWDISERFYGTPWLFPELADANRIPNPNMIYAESDMKIPEQLLRRSE